MAYVTRPALLPQDFILPTDSSNKTLAEKKKTNLPKKKKKTLPKKPKKKAPAKKKAATKKRPIRKRKLPWKQ